MFSTQPAEAELSCTRSSLCATLQGLAPVITRLHVACSDLRKITNPWLCVLFGATVPFVLLAWLCWNTFPSGTNGLENYWVPCAAVDCLVATTLENAPLKSLKHRKFQKGITVVDDFETVIGGNVNTSYFSIPKTVHQIWLGDKPPPFVWIDTWR